MRYKAKNRKAKVKETNTALRAIMIMFVAHKVMLHCHNISLLMDRRFSADSYGTVLQHSGWKWSVNSRQSSSARQCTPAFVTLVSGLFFGKNLSELYPRLPTTYIWHFAALIFSEIEETFQGQTTFIDWHILKPRKQNEKCRQRIVWTSVPQMVWRSYWWNMRSLK
jgi:hypothetical protein